MPSIKLEVSISAASFMAGFAVCLGSFSKAYGVLPHYILADLFMRLFLRPAPSKTSSPSKPTPQDKAWLPKAVWLTKHEALVQPARKDCKLLFIGDSITEGWLGAGIETWKRKYLPHGAINLGIGGDEVQHVLWRVQNGALKDLVPKAVVLLIGTNNIGNVGHKGEDVAEGIRLLILEIQKHLPGAKLLLLAVFPRDRRPGTPFRKEISLLNDTIKGYHDGASVSVLDINHLFVDSKQEIPSEIMPDFLHLSSKAYEFWADGMESTLKPLLQ